jgi:polyhydroxyalkanoate synthesis regulator protein
MLNIVKYSNRKLYSVNDHKYISLKEINEWVRAGRSITVAVHKTGEDVTDRTMAAAAYYSQFKGVKK